MTNFMTVVGGLGLLAGGVALLVAASAYLLHVLAEREWARERAWERRTIQDLGRSLKQQAYWFSEDEGAMNALIAVGEQLHGRGKFDISDARDIWRKGVEGIAAGHNA
jgi:hypothetical protein